MFEMTAMMILDPSAPGCPVYRIKCADQFKGLFDERRPMTEETGRAMAEWARGHGKGQLQKAEMDKARDVARKGRDALQAYWSTSKSTMDDDTRGAVWGIMDELKGIAMKAEANAAAATGDNLFASDDVAESDTETAAMPVDIEEQIRRQHEADLKAASAA
jgi:hypothetical protein